jgi:hypothetical protein
MFTKHKCERRDKERQQTWRAAIYLRGSGEDEANLVKAPSIDQQRPVRSWLLSRTITLRRRTPDRPAESCPKGWRQW